MSRNVGRAVFLDRDGVLNQVKVRDGKPYPPESIEEVHILPGVREALLHLREKGFLLYVVTNQPDVARGTQTVSAVERIHAFLESALPLDGIYVCYHDDRDGCSCRKPAPGSMLAAAREHQIDLSESYLVGDRWRDIEAGIRAGCRTAWIDYGYTEPKPKSPPDVRVTSLSEAAEWILQQARKDTSNMKSITQLNVKLFADGADKAGMLEMYRNPIIRGFTTNPTLMRKAQIKDYETFAREMLALIPDRPLSLEVFADDFPSMEQQARQIAGWADNVFVKIPVTNTKGESTSSLVHRLSHDGIKVNVTALLTIQQVEQVIGALRGGAPANVSVFAGRIADTGRDPIPLMSTAVAMLRECPQGELIWASPRELLNIFQADEIGCHIITATNDILKKLTLIGKDLAAYSLETVRMFYTDAVASQYSIAKLTESLAVKY